MVDYIHVAGPEDLAQGKTLCVEVEGREVRHGYLGKLGKGTSKVMPNYGDEFIYLPPPFRTAYKPTQKWRINFVP